MEILNTSFLNPIINGSEKLGINVEKILQQSELKYFNYNDANAYVPMYAANEFLTSLCDNQGIDDVASVYSDFINISALTDFSSLLDNSLSLLDACLIAEQMSNCILSNEILKLEIIGNKVIFKQHFTNLSVKEYERVVQINLIYLLSGFKAIAPINWAPSEVYYQSNIIPEAIDNLISSSKTKVFVNQPYSAVIFETEDLITLAPRMNTSVASETGLKITHPNSLQQKMEELFHSYKIDSSKPSMIKVADFMGVSERTLRRKLREEEITFNEILSSWRTRQAIHLLKNINLSIEDISQQLYYANAKNFTRAFKRTFQICPSLYRETLNR